jgi:hypothetical protein
LICTWEKSSNNLAVKPKIHKSSEFSEKYLQKIPPSSKIQNGGWIQDGGENVFFILKFLK